MNSIPSSTSIPIRKFEIRVSILIGHGVWNTALHIYEQPFDVQGSPGFDSPCPNKLVKILLSLDCLFVLRVRDTVSHTYGHSFRTEGIQQFSGPQHTTWAHSTPPSPIRYVLHRVGFLADSEHVHFFLIPCTVPSSSRNSVSLFFSSPRMSSDRPPIVSHSLRKFAIRASNINRPWCTEHRL
jgi:hypothetical protein